MAVHRLNRICRCDLSSHLGFVLFCFILNCQYLKVVISLKKNLDSCSSGKIESSSSMPAELSSLGGYIPGLDRCTMDPRVPSRTELGFMAPEVPLSPRGKKKNSTETIHAELLRTLQVRAYEVEASTSMVNPLLVPPTALLHTQPVPALSESGASCPCTVWIISPATIPSSQS